MAFSARTGAAGHETGDRAGRTTPSGRIGVAEASTDEVDAAIDCLLARQDSIEAQLAARHHPRQTTPVADGVVRPVLLVGDWAVLPAAKRGYSRDGKKGLPQIEYG